MADVGTSEEERERVLLEVNETLVREGLPPWSTVRRIGRIKDREHQIVGVIRVVRDVQTHYTTIVFRTMRPIVDASGRPTWEPGEFGLRLSRPAAKVVAVVNGQVIFSSEHRPALGKWPVEIPRGWISWAEEADPFLAVRAILTRKVGKAWWDGLSSVEPVKVGEGPDDPGYHDLIVPVYYFAATNEVPLPNWNDVRTHRPYAYTWERVHKMEDEGAISDDRTLSALRKVERYLERTTGKRV